MRILLVAGPGRIHFVEVASALAKAKVPLRFICGLKPTSSWRRACDVAGKLLARPNLYSRLAIRMGPGGILEDPMIGFAFPEAVVAFGARISNLLRRENADWISAWTWRFYGFCLRGKLADYDILHIRSGAGRGGAIEKAKREGKIVIVDHSIAHPDELFAQLAGECVRFGMPVRKLENERFWRQVLADCQEADMLLVNSDYVKSTFVKNGYDPDKISVLYLGVRDDFIGIKKSHSVCADVIKILFTGTFDLRKGARVLIEAVRYLTEAGVAVELDVAGDATEMVKLMPAELAGLPIRLHGYLPQRQLMKLLIDADLYVFPTFCEGCAKSAMEAMVAGLPVITTDACGLPGVAGEHWWRVPAGSVEELAKGIVELGRNHARRVAIGEAGTVLAKNGDFTWGAYATRLENLYKTSATAAAQ